MDLGTAVAAAWSSGISMYGVLAVLGIAGRAAWIDTPEGLQQTWVIGVAVVLFVAELVVDKIPYVDSAWDAVHTVLRPMAGGYILTTVADVRLSGPALAVGGVVLALTSHSAKASTRLVINASPEPVSNVAASVAEDGLVAVVLVLAVAAPQVALVVALILAVCSAVVAVVLYRLARRIARRLRRGVRPAA